MKLTKRILCLTLAVTLICALCACGKKADDNKDGGNTTTTTTQSTTTTTADDWGGNLDGENIYNDGEFDWG